MLPVRGPRLQVRPWALDDIEVHRHWMQPHHQWHRTDGPYFPRSDEAAIDGQCTRLRERIPQGNVTMGDFRVPVADGSGAMIGSVSRYHLDSTGWTALGIAIYDPEHWGRGYATEALRLWIDVVFGAYIDAHRLDLRTWSGNLGMMRVAERLGFTLEARFREARLVEGERYDGLGYGLLREEWVRSSS